MKILTVFYSRTGNTGKVAKLISQSLKTDIEEIYDLKDRSGPLGYLVGGRDGMLKKTTQINKQKFDPGQYDLTIIGTPIWVNISPAVRTYLKTNSGKFKSVIFFCTMGGSDPREIFVEMEKLTKVKPSNVLAITTNQVKDNSYIEIVKKFVSNLSTNP